MYNAVIIDDEKDGINVLKQFLKKLVSFDIHVCGTAGNLKNGIQIIKKEQPEIVFLDIDMPKENGLAIFQHFHTPKFKIIFVTAHKQYAIEALNNAATGYLLKPVSIIDLKEILTTTVSRIKNDQQFEELEDRINVLHAANKDDQAKLFETENGFEMLSLRNIEYCIAQQSYSTIVMHTKKEMIVSKPLIRLIEQFPDNMFYRTHKSYLVNIYYIRKFIKGNQSYVIMRSGTKIPVSVRISKSITADINRMLK